MKKLYALSLNDEYSYTKDSILLQMEDEGLTEITVYETEKEKVEDFFYCKYYETWGGIGYDYESCGSNARNIALVMVRAESVNIQLV